MGKAPGVNRLGKSAAVLRSANGVMPNYLTKGLYQTIPATLALPSSNLQTITRSSAIMSRPVLSSATRRLPRYCAHSPVIIARSHRLISTTQPVLSISKLHDRGLPSAQPEANVLSASRQVRSHRNRFLRPSASPFAAPRQQVAFASTLAKVVLNSRTDDDGNVLTVDISERAAEVRRNFSFAAVFDNAAW